MEKRPVIVHKTREQRLAQQRLANTEIKLGHGYPATENPLLDLSPRELRDALHQDRIATRGYSRSSEDYEAFVKALRQVRREQAPQIKTTADQARARTEEPQGVSIREAVLSSVEFSSPLATKVLDNMEYPSTPGLTYLNRLFSEQQVKEGAKSEASFVALLREGAARKPSDVIRRIEEFSGLLPEEATRGILDVALAKDPMIALTYLFRPNTFYTEAERRLLIEQGLEADPRGTAALSLFYYDNAGLFTDEEVRNYVHEACLKALPNDFQAAIVQGLIRRRILQSSEVPVLIIASIPRAQGSLGDVSEHLKFFSDEQRGDLKEAIRAAYTRDDDRAIQLWTFDPAKAVFTKEEQASLIYEIIAKKPDQIARGWEAMRDVLDPDEVGALAREAIRTKNKEFFHGDHYSEAVLRDLLHGDILTPAEKRQIQDTLIFDFPTSAVFIIDLAVEGRSPTEQEAAVRSIIPEAMSLFLLEKAPSWIGYISGGPDVHKTMLDDIISRENDYAFIRCYLNGALGGLFSKEEIERHLEDQQERGVTRAFREATAIREFLGGDDQLRGFLDHAAIIDPYGLVASFDQFSYLYTPEETKGFIEDIADNERGFGACIDGIRGWGSVLTKEDVFQFLDQYKARYTERLLSNLHWWEHVPPGKRRALLGDCIAINPPAALEHFNEVSRFDVIQSQEEIVSMGSANDVLVAYAPITLREFYNDILRTTDRASRRSMIIDAKEVYTSINAIRLANLSADFNTIRPKDGFIKAKEEEALAIFYCFALFKQSDPERFAQISTLGESLEESRVILLQEITKRMGLSREITATQAQRFFSTMGTPGPFTLYYLQYEKSDRHVGVLKGLFEALLDGRFNEWKFGQRNDEALEELKEAQLLPKLLSNKQYDTWRTDDETPLSEVLDSDASAVSHAIRQVIIDNQDHLDLELFDLPETPFSQLLNQAREELTKVGVQLGAIGTRQGELGRLARAKHDDPSDREAIDRELADLRVQRTALQALRDKLALSRDILRLLTLKPQEVVEGYLLEGDELAKRSEPLGALSDRLSSQLPRANFVFERINQYLLGFQSQTGTRQRLVCTDSSDPQVTLEIGDKPVASCQHYSHGSHNDCLLGYFDANSKMIILRNANGNLISRAVFRILADPDGNPSLHIERNYSAVAAEGVLKSVFTHAHKKATAMGMRLFISQQAQNEQGQKVTADIPSGFEAREVPEGFQLTSFASKAPKIYVDSAGGVRSQGKYNIDNLLELKTY
ncbi:hypothetical protein A2631_03310 [Candidatus Daviesbacteria bacterium RIFCSPHIGHO2_01_FULL_44_29]|uniref:Uncharacterized protein n=1 Tax=Candidatus Daviesbacteria bacterium RIFCSPHIGHO2_02_FULL_43_12 TaxID=1797776 RepID=A0A1F5KLB2_9BACT|nr:MAG: hypothetical protein A2631_03310 [Candidatus Daviesbacteria bacterium RIFCSPHIGHO2_01_FULL_44_29]OGE41411.1 MAG: hypothetical protein A3D25_02705 [Candidatus Daviesbacteria bacterium RIFCSPHIGHO2_02_FULL_43_12]OGE69611.1 MAG: hypothetical protein A3B55_04450 [Candidatus Daviesbacteria bacterium RIFCSPLOWO2_01_FULL_43_15]